MKTTFVATILNEEDSIRAFLDSLFLQTRIPNETILVDGGSSDKTKELITKYQKQFPKRNIRLLQKRGNRAIGRNFGILHAENEIILLSDAGCVLDRNWVEEISKPFVSDIAQVVAGYYEGRGESLFQKCLVPYVLVMPDKIIARKFLPATRSMAIRKSVWKKNGRFPERFSHNEDYVFAKRLEMNGAKITFIRTAIVYWMPPHTIKKAFIMFLRFAYGDMEAGIVRWRVIGIFLRYAVFFAIISLFLQRRSSFIELVLFILVFTYIIWSVLKNFRYIKKWQAVFLLPVMQISIDAAVIAGSSLGFVQTFFIGFLRNKKR